MSLTEGQKLGHFEIVEPIGKGGMGEVYRARDTKLGRDVAIKVLPQDFLDDAERVARFEREARLLAALNHPNIATIHGIEESDNQQFLVMELVEGQTLAERIARGAIPLGAALPLFEQIARGLEAAHEKSVIHRDLKPPNIIISPDGTPKLLDFGLAKAYSDDAVETGLSQSPTLSRGTAAGVILGTAPYMSPEQARGKSVDKRTDIWAFACCLYEALTDRPAFMGETVTDTIAKIVEREPDWSRLPARTPVRIHELLRRCLQKDSGERLRDIGDARLEIRTALSAPEEIVPSSKIWPRKGLAIVGSLLAGVVLATTFASHRAPELDATVVRFGIPLAPTDQLSDPYGRAVAFSPSGSHIAYAANGRLYLRGIDQFNATELLGSEGAAFPFFSPDGRSIGFFADGEIKRLSILGGDPLTLCAADDADAFDRSASWGPDDTIVFVTGRASVFGVSASGGTPELVAEVDVEAGDVREIRSYHRTAALSSSRSEARGILQTRTW